MSSLQFTVSYILLTKSYVYLEDGDSEYNKTFTISFFVGRHRIVTSIAGVTCIKDQTVYRKSEKKLILIVFHLKFNGKEVYF